MAVWNPQANDLFLQALEVRDPAEREAFVVRASGDDAALCAQVRALLQASERAGSFLDGPASLPTDAGSPGTAEMREGPGALIGPYKLLQPIGEGGMGAVFMAEQTRPVQRRVALKIIKPGMDSKQVVARFEAERQALALMDHPHIARVLDGGTTDSGRPYFVMELVKGVPITRYCDEHRLTPRQRLELFIPVCQAVQHAHQKGIIHRDLKPSNVLVALYDGKPVPKVIDFGIAKATGAKLTERTLFTDFGAVVGTLEYMSPEQAQLNQLDIDTRSDIYSLGALLYELLTGTTPLERGRAREAGLLEALRIIREEEPPRPSTRLSTTEELPAIAANRGLEPKRLSGLVKGELDWIVMTCLEKDRNRRYESANGLARDIERYLADEPVLACPPSAGYRLRKYVRRNRGPVLAVTLVLFSLLAGAAVSLYYAFEAGARARDYLDQKELADGAARDAREEKALAVAEKERYRHALYVTEMSPVWRFRQEGKFDQAVGVLGKQRPGRGESDQRGWEWHHQWRLCHPELLLLTGHRSGSGISQAALAFSPDGRRLASAGGDPAEPGELILWDLSTGREERRLPGHKRAISDAAFSPDGRTLASASWDGSIRLWDAADGRVRHVLAHETDTGHRVSFNPDGRLLVSLCNIAMGDFKGDKSYATVKLWDVATGRQTGAWTLPKVQVSLLTFLPDGRLLRVAGQEVTMREAATDRELQRFVHTTKGRYAALPAAASMIGRRLALAGTDGIALWDLERGLPGPLLKWPGKEQPNDLAFNPDGQRLAAAGADGAVWVWDLAQRQPVPEVIRLLGKDVHCVAFSPDGLRLAASGQDGVIRLLDAGTTSEERRRFPTPKGARQAIFTPDGERLLVVPELAPVLQVHDAVSGRMLPGPREGRGPVAYSPDGRRLASGGLEGIRLWDPTTGREVQTIRTARMIAHLAFLPDGRLVSVAAAEGSSAAVVQVWDAAGRELLTLNGHPHFVAGLAVRPDGKRVATIGRGPKEPARLNVWDAGSGKELLALEVAQPGTAVAYSPDGTLLATAGIDRLGPTGQGSDAAWSVQLRDATTGQARRAFAWPGGQVFATAFSADGRLLAATGDHHVKAWDVAGGQEVFSFQGQAEQGHTLAFSPSGRRLASGDLDRAVKIWDLDGKSEPLSLKGMSCWGADQGLAFSPDGTRLATGGGPVRIWSTSSGEELRCLAGHAFGVKCLAVSADGRRVASGGSDGAVRVWDLENWEPLRAFHGPGAPVSAVAFSPDGRLLASGGGKGKEPGEVRLWDLASGRELHRLSGHARPIVAVAFGADGESLVSFSEDGTARVWDVANGMELRSTQVSQVVHSAAISADARLLACGGEGRVLLWDAVHGGEARALTGQHTTRSVYAVAFSPDGRRIVSCGERETKLWDVATGQELYTLSGTARATGLAFSPDGGRLVAATGNSLTIWDGRELTADAALDREALGLLDALFARAPSRKDVVERLRNHPALREPVRERALRLAERYRE